MAPPDFSLPLTINCNASEKWLGLVLYQEQNGQMKVISYASTILTPAEKNYNLHSEKFLALKYAINKKFQDYIYYLVFSDNNPLTYVMGTTKLNATGMRWIA